MRRIGLLYDMSVFLCVDFASESPTRGDTHRHPHSHGRLLRL
jgi:hypothetical protein